MFFQLLAMRLFLLSLLWSYAYSQSILLTEVMANPHSLSDSHGEYIELVLRDSSLPFPSPLIIHKKDTLTLPIPSAWPNSKTLWVCKDSILSPYCDLTWSNLSLTNSDTLLFTLCSSPKCDTFSVPPSKPGISWENQFDEASHSSHWLLSSTKQSKITPDIGSPGIPPPSLHGLIAKHVVIKTIAPTQNIITLYNLGHQPAKDFVLYQQYDLDGNDSSDLPYDSVKCCPYPILPNTSHQLTFPKSTRSALNTSQQIPHIIWSVSPSHNPFLETFSYWNSDNISIKFTEICPVPFEGMPEWFEITNHGNHSLYLHNIQYNRKPLLSKQNLESNTIVAIAPQQSLIVTSDKKSFLNAYPRLQIPVLEKKPWDILKNSGDTLLLSVPSYSTSEAFEKNNTMDFTSNLIIDSMIYPSDNKQHNGQFNKQLLAKEGECYILNPLYSSSESASTAIRWIPSPATPGYTQPPPTSFSWSIFPRILNKDKEEHFEIALNIPPLQEANAYIFDLAGQKVHTLCSPCAGTIRTYWNGKTTRNETLPMGPYILWIQRKGHSPIKHIVILGKTLS